MLQRGGIRISESPKNAFEQFIRNADIRYLSHGSFGVTVTAVLRPDVNDSPYTSNRIGTYNLPVRRLIIKFALLEPYEDSDETRATAQEKFANEVNIQTDIYLKTMSYLQPLCPAVVYSMIYEPENAVDLGPSAQLPMYPASQLWDMISDIPSQLYPHKNADMDVGVIAMEFADGYDTVKNTLKKSSRFNRHFYDKMGGFIQMVHLLIELAMQTGYVQGDHHGGNILVNPNADNYYKGLRGSWMIIDFGEGQKIHPDVMATMRDMVVQQKYTDILKLIYSIDRLDGIKMHDHVDFYGYIVGKYNLVTKEVMSGFGDSEAHINQSIYNLIIARQAKVDELADEMLVMHNEEPTMYPILPLSKAVRNDMYSGLFMEDAQRGGKRRRRHTKRTRSRRTSIKRTRQIRKRTQRRR